MKTRLAKLLAGTGLAVAVALSASTLASSASAARPIQPLCGPTFQWACSGLGGPDVLFIGTICDKIKFEKKTGKTCTPF